MTGRENISVRFCRNKKEGASAEEAHRLSKVVTRKVNSGFVFGSMMTKMK